MRPIIHALRYLHAFMTSPKGRKQRLYYCLFHTSNHLNPFPQILFRDYPILNSHNRRFSQCSFLTMLFFPSHVTFYPHKSFLLILEHLKKNNICVVYVPARCTDRLQPIDLTVQQTVKAKLKTSFENWYSEKIVAQIKNKRAMMALDRSPESFSPQMNSTSLFLWFKLVTPGVGPVLIPRGII